MKSDYTGHPDLPALLQHEEGLSEQIERARIPNPKRAVDLAAILEDEREEVRAEIRRLQLHGR